MSHLQLGKEYASPAQLYSAPFLHQYETPRKCSPFSPTPLPVPHGPQGFLPGNQRPAHSVSPAPSRPRPSGLPESSASALREAGLLGLAAGPLWALCTPSFNVSGGRVYWWLNSQTLVSGWRILGPADEVLAGTRATPQRLRAHPPANLLACRRPLTLRPSGWRLGASSCELWDLGTPYSVTLTPYFVWVSFIAFCITTLSRPCWRRLCHFFGAERPVASVFPSLPSKLGISGVTEAFQSRVLLSPNSALSLAGKWEGRGLPGLGYSRNVAGSGLQPPGRPERRARAGRPRQKWVFRSPVHTFGTIILDCSRLLNRRVQLCWNSIFSHFRKEQIEIQSVRIVCFRFSVARPCG